MTELLRIKPHIIVDRIIFYNFDNMLMGSGTIRYLDADTYPQLTNDDYLLVIYRTNPMIGFSFGSELDILESLHKRIIRLENMNARS